MARPIRLESRTEEEAQCLLSVLAAYSTTGPYHANGVWIVDVEANGDREQDRVLEEVISAVLGCFAAGEIGGFTLDADGHRIPVGFAPSEGEP